MVIIRLTLTFFLACLKIFHHVDESHQVHPSPVESSRGIPKSENVYNQKKKNESSQVQPRPYESNRVLASPATRRRMDTIRRYEKQVHSSVKRDSRDSLGLNKSCPVSARLKVKKIIQLHKTKMFWTKRDQLGMNLSFNGMWRNRDLKCDCL